jgi:hypothetical protein
MDILDYTHSEIQKCWWYSDDLQDIRSDAKKFVSKNYDKKNPHASEFRGLERFTHSQRRAALYELSLEAILYDNCLDNYQLHAKLALREAQERAQRDALAVIQDHKNMLVGWKKSSSHTSLTSCASNHSLDSLSSKSGSRRLRRDTALTNKSTATASASSGYLQKLLPKRRTQVARAS